MTEQEAPTNVFEAGDMSDFIAGAKAMAEYIQNRGYVVRGRFVSGNDILGSTAELVDAFLGMQGETDD
jgi:hypothetical protein